MKAVLITWRIKKKTSKTKKKKNKRTKTHRNAGNKSEREEKTLFENKMAAKRSFDLKGNKKEMKKFFLRKNWLSILRNAENIKVCKIENVD